MVCASCHGQDGLGVKIDGQWLAPSLHTSKFVTGDQAELLTALILKGIAKDDTRYTQPMVPLESALSDEQIAEIVAYTTEAFGGQRRDVTATDVATWREKYQDHSLPWHRSELAAKLVPDVLTDLHFSVYSASETAAGPSQALRSGGLPSNQLSTKSVADLNHPCVVVFTGLLHLTEADDYEFRLEASPGSALTLGGETLGVVESSDSLRVRQRLEAGSYPFELRYLASAGAATPELTLRARTTRKSFTLHETD